MAEKKVSDLTAATVVNDADEFLLVQSGTSKRVAADVFMLPLNYIVGLITSNDAGDIPHDIAIAPGVARSDDDTANLKLAAILTKQIDATWAVGDDAGGMEAADHPVQADTLYALWLIKRSDTGVVDAMFSLDFSSPTLPTDYDSKRLIGAIATGPGANVTTYTQSGDYFRYAAQLLDVNDGTITDEVFETGTLRAPPLSLAQVYVALSNTTSTAIVDGRVWVKTKGATEIASINDAFQIQAVDTDPFERMVSKGAVLVNEDSQIEYAAAKTTGAATVAISVIGFTMFTRRDP